MPIPATPDDAAAGETQRPSLIPAGDFPTLLTAIAGQSLVQHPDNTRVYTWEYRPPVAPDPPLQLYAYDEFRALPPATQRAAIEGSWDTAPRPQDMIVSVPHAGGSTPVRVRDWEVRHVRDVPRYRSDMAGRYAYLPDRPPTTVIRFSVDLAGIAVEDPAAVAGVLLRQLAGADCVVRRWTGNGRVLDVEAELVQLPDHPPAQVGGVLADVLAAQDRPAMTVPRPRYTVAEPTPEQLAAAAQWQREQDARRAQERADRAAAEGRAESLLLSLLTPRQRREYAESQTIPVRGSDKRRYRLVYDTVGNVKELNRAGVEIASWCAAPAGNLPIADVLAAQLLWLRHDAPGFRAVANRMEGISGAGQWQGIGRAYRLDGSMLTAAEPCNCPLCQQGRDL
jgi:hypothetical protein